MQALPNRRNLFPPAFRLSSDLGDEGRPDDLPGEDRQPRRHGAQAVGREMGAATPKAGIAAGDGARGSGGPEGERGGAVGRNIGRPYRRWAMSAGPTGC
jgi:hypothetical protein